MVHAGLHGPEGNSDANRHLGQRKAEVVVVDQDGALLDGEPPEGTLELVSIVDSRVLVRPVHGLDGEDPDTLRPSPVRLVSA